MTPRPALRGCPSGSAAGGLRSSPPSCCSRPQWSPSWVREGRHREWPGRAASRGGAGRRRPHRPGPRAVPLCRRHRAPRREAPRANGPGMTTWDPAVGALPATGALLITAIVVVWLTSALWLFSDPVSTGDRVARKRITASDVTSRNTQRHIASTESTCVTTRGHEICSSRAIFAGPIRVRIPLAPHPKLVNRNSCSEAFRPAGRICCASIMLSVVRGPPDRRSRRREDLNDGPAIRHAGCSRHTTSTRVMRSACWFPGEAAGAAAGQR
jgi:hypothetical protein